jgi:hypothetical protein
MSFLHDILGFVFSLIIENKKAQWRFVSPKNPQNTALNCREGGIVYGLRNDRGYRLHLRQPWFRLRRIGDVRRPDIDPGASARLPHNDIMLGKVRKGRANCRAIDIEYVREFPLCGQPLAGAVFLPLDLLSKLMCDFATCGQPFRRSRCYGIQINYYPSKSQPTRYQNIISEIDCFVKSYFERKQTTI